MSLSKSLCIYSWQPPYPLLLVEEKETIQKPKKKQVFLPWIHYKHWSNHCVYMCVVCVVCVEGCVLCGVCVYVCVVRRASTVVCRVLYVCV